jgi:hypothetical protein
MFFEKPKYYNVIKDTKIKYAMANGGPFFFSLIYGRPLISSNSKFMSTSMSSDVLSPSFNYYNILFFIFILLLGLCHEFNGVNLGMGIRLGLA